MAQPPAAPGPAPAYGPALPELVRARFGLGARAVALVFAAVVVVVVVAGLALHRVGAEPSFSHGGAVPFSLSYGAPLHRVAPGPGEILRLEAHRDGRVIESVVVRPVRLPPYSGASTGVVPLVAGRLVQQLAAREPGAVPAGEGRLNPGVTPLYGVGYVARRGSGTVYGLEAIAVPDRPGARDGVRLSLVETREAGARSAADVGSAGALRLVLRSFSLG